MPTWEIAPEIAQLRLATPTIARNVTVPPGAAVPLAVPRGASGDTVEVLLKLSHDCVMAGPVGVSVRATAGASPAEQTRVTYSATDGLQLNTTTLDSNGDVSTRVRSSSSSSRSLALLRGGTCGGAGLQLLAVQLQRLRRSAAPSSRRHHHPFPAGLRGQIGSGGSPRRAAVHHDARLPAVGAGHAPCADQLREVAGASGVGHRLGHAIYLP